MLYRIMTHTLQQIQKAYNITFNIGIRIFQ